MLPPPRAYLPCPHRRIPSRHNPPGRPPLVVVFHQGRKRGDVGDDDAEVVLDGGPEDEGRRVDVVDELLDGLDADDLDDGDEDAEPEEAEENELLAALDAGSEEDGKGRSILPARG